MAFKAWGLIFWGRQIHQCTPKRKEFLAALTSYGRPDLVIWYLGMQKSNRRYTTSKTMTMQSWCCVEATKNHIVNQLLMDKADS